MKKGKRRMGMRHAPTVSLKMKTTQRVVIAAGISVALLSLGVFLYMNFGQVTDSKAAIVDRLCIAATPGNDFEVKSIVQLPPEQRPASASEPGIINKRSAKVLQQN